ncbi:hypothetical protein HPP92_004113 [Vanilla planifolia]|uniref:Uncharacterized protein n=1 Tax=Vanilla planifolia TaxID=51239 RepID=A0A835S8F7_VANPL|nr:hypothetical protein HPP92_004113 [Vanilla planifolia]
MAHHNKFLSVNLNKSYGKSSSSNTSYGNGHPRSAGSGGGMVVLSRQRSSSGTVAYKSTPKLSVPPPVNLPSLRKEHERFDLASLKPSAGYGGSGPGPGNAPSMGWTKPAPPVLDFREKDSGARTPSSIDRTTSGTSHPQGFVDKAMILRGEDFPSLLATSTATLQQKQKQVRESSEGWAEKAESSVVDMRPQLRSSSLIKSNIQGGDCGSTRIIVTSNQPRQADGNYPGPLPIVRVRHTYDWDDDERDRNHIFSGIEHREGRLLPNGEARNHLPRDSDRVESYRRELVTSKNEGSDISSWGLTAPSNKDSPNHRLLNHDRDHASAKNSAVSKETGKESIISRSPLVERRVFGSSIGNGNAEVAKGKTVSNGLMSKGLISPGSANFPSNNPALNFSKEKLTSNVRKPYVEDDTWGGKSTLSCDDIFDLRTKIFRKKRETTKHSDLFDPARESFEAELERVQQLQELGRQRVLEEQTRAMEFARREAEERDRIAREEEEKRRLLEEEAREAAWRAEQEKLEAAKRAEEQRIAREEEKRKMLMEEERRKEAARKKLLELEARIAQRQIEANLKNDRTKEMDLPIDLNVAERKNAEGLVEVITNSASPESSLTNRLSECCSRPNSWSIENYSYSLHGKSENNLGENQASSFKFKDQDNGYLSLHQDAFSSKGGPYRKDFWGNEEPLSIMQHYRGGKSNDLTYKGPVLDRDRDGSRFVDRPNFDAAFSHDQKSDDRKWEHGHFNGSYIVSYSERSFHDNEVDDLASSSRVRNSLRQPRVLPPLSSSSSVHRNSFRVSAEDSNSLVSMNVDVQNDQIGRREESDMKIMYGHRYQQRIQETRMPEVLEETGSYLLQMEENGSPRYDSQSSVSVSNPPSTPTQPSHYEFDDCGVSLALTASLEEGSIVFSDRKDVMQEMDAEHRDTTLTPLSHGEDDEWAIENHEGIQKGYHNEGHDGSVENNGIDEGCDGNVQTENMLEDLGLIIEKPIKETKHPSYTIDEWALVNHEGMQKGYHNEGQDCSVENNGIREGGDGNIQTENMLEDISLVIEKTIREVKRPSYAIDECVQLGASSNCIIDDEYGNVENEKTNVGNIANFMTEVASINKNANTVQSEVASPENIIDSSVVTAEKSDKASEDPVIHAITSTDNLCDSIGAPESQNPMTPESSFPLPLTLSPCSSSSSLGVSCQNEMPVKLQFGLFSGPPLIPSPLPIIQIGSIQMPLPFLAQNDSCAQVHSLQPPLFQFGQIRYTPPVPQCALPTQTMPILHPSSLSHHSINQNHGNVTINQSNKTSTSRKQLDSISTDEQPSCAPVVISSFQDNFNSEQLSTLLNVSKDEVLVPQSQISSSASVKKKSLYKLSSVSGTSDVSSTKYFRSTVNSKCIRGRLDVDSLSSVRKATIGQSSPGTISEIRGNRFSYNSRNAGSLSFFARADNLHVNSSRTQRRFSRYIHGTRYRAKKYNGARQMNSSKSLDHIEQNENSTSFNGFEKVSLRNMGRKAPFINKNSKLANEEANSCNSQFIGACSSVSGASPEETVTKAIMASFGKFHSEGNLKKNNVLEDDIDAPLRIGIVRIFNQPGIEASADADGFVEVPRGHRTILSSNVISSKSDVVTGGSSTRANFEASFSNRRPSAVLEVTQMSTVGMESQNITQNSISDADFVFSEAKLEKMKFNQANSEIPSRKTNPVPNLSYAENSVARDKASVPLGVRGTVQLDKSGKSSIQSQVDETLTAVEANAESLSKVDVVHCKHVTPAMILENPSSSSTSLLNFPLAGEKIQFGAVASLPTLSPSSQSVPGGIWPPGSVILNASIVHNLTVKDKIQSSFYDKDRHSADSCAHLDDNEAEAEAEAAASAVAVAAISNDEITVSTLSSDSISNENKLFRDAGIARCMDAAVQSASEESSIVALPADLTVDTPHTLWPPLTNLQSTRPILSSIAGPPPSSFPFFDPNPMLGSPIFSFRSSDDSMGTQSQQQHNAKFGSEPSGTWSHCHSGVDSFYGSPAGFPAPFMNPPGGLTGVHGQPQMVFYNHFAPVGQFGQVGISYMGATYIPTGNQPVWEHNSKAAPMNSSKADPGNQNNVYGPHKTAHLPAPVQHLSTGSAVMSVTSPYTMFNLRPFQSSTDISVPVNWPPVPLLSNPTRHPVASELQQGLPTDVSANFVSHEPRPYIADLPDELGLVESTSSNSESTLQTLRTSGIPLTNSNIREANGTGIGIVSCNNSQNVISSKVEPPLGKPLPIHQQLGPFGKTTDQQRGAMKIRSGGEWHRRDNFQWKHHKPTSDKKIGYSKIKQVYVAKSRPTDPANAC